MTYRRWFTILCAILLICVAVLACGVALAARIVRQPDYPRQVGDPSVLIQDKAFTAHGEQCDILIDGDSTASTGIDPRVIAQQTGMPACSIASSRPIFDTLAMLPLDTWLEHNPAPRVLIIQFGPELYYRASNWEHVVPFTPFVMLFRDVSMARALELLLLHPTFTLQATQAVLKLYSRTRTRDAEREAVYTRTIDIFNQSRGFFNIEAQPITSCDYPPLELYGPLDKAWIQQLRAKYEARGILTLIDSAPIPDCDPQLAFFQHELTPYLDANTRALPVSLFIPGGRHMHAGGARAQALLLAAQIQSRLHSQPPAQPPRDVAGITGR